MTQVNQLGRYELLKPLGSGGMAEVHLARVRGVAGFEKLVVVKKVLARHQGDVELRAMLADEARLAALLSHPNVAQVYDIGIEGSTLFFAMEFIDGADVRTLQRLARDRGETVPVPVALSIVCGAAAGLHAAHEARDVEGRPLSVVHRDVSPGNVLVTRDGVVKVVDFGIAKAASSSQQTNAGVVRGTRPYMSPEQCRAEPLDRRSDVFSLGILLFELSTGARLFRADSDIALVRLILDAPLPAPEDVVPGYPPELARVVKRALARDRTERFESAQALEVALQEFARERKLDLSAVALSSWVRERLPPAQAATVSAMPAEPLPPLAQPEAGETKTVGAMRQTAVAKRPPRRWPLFMVAGVMLAAGTATLGVRLFGPDPRMKLAWRHAQHEEYETARVELAAFVADHPRDGEALARLALVEWWVAGDKKALANALAVPQPPPRRAMLEGLSLLETRRVAEAQAFLERANRENPGAPEVLYMLGEVYWHGGRLLDGAAALRAAFDADPDWAIALHHVLDLELSRGKPEALEELVPRLAAVDPALAASLQSQLLFASRRYAEAAAVARKGLELDGDAAQLYARVTEAVTLGGDARETERAARAAFERWPVDDREWGGFSLWCERMLYRGDLDGYMRTMAGHSGGRFGPLTEVLWQGKTSAGRSRPKVGGTSSTPLTLAVYLVSADAEGLDFSDLLDEAVEPEVKAYGAALVHVRRGDPMAAGQELERALQMPSRGDTRMLLAHTLARVRMHGGDVEGAAKACEEVRFPRRYRPYRAALLPDCVLWTAQAQLDRSRRDALLRPLVDGWTGSFEHAAVVKARALLAE